MILNRVEIIMSEVFSLAVVAWVSCGLLCYTMQVVEDVVRDREFFKRGIKTHLLELALCVGLGAYGLVDYSHYTWLRYVQRKEVKKPDEFDI
jgi:hypothetical protein